MVPRFAPVIADAVDIGRTDCAVEKYISQHWQQWVVQSIAYPDLNPARKIQLETNSFPPKNRQPRMGMPYFITGKYGQSQISLCPTMNNCVQPSREVSWVKGARYSYKQSPKLDTISVCLFWVAHGRAGIYGPDDSHASPGCWINVGQQSLFEQSDDVNF